MQKINHQLYFSPSDLTCFIESSFASWMNRLHIEAPDIAPQKDVEDPLMALLAQRGYAHEDALEKAFIKQGKSVYKIRGNNNLEKYQATLKAMKDGVEVIVQARLKRDQFAGFSDFLVKTEGESGLGNYHYEVWDTKLSRKVKPQFLIQLSCYAEMLASMQGRKPEYITVVLGNGEQERFKTQDYFYYYQNVKQAFIDFQQQWSQEHRYDPAMCSSWGRWSTYAQTLLLECDHLSQVANITRGQIKKLNASGIQTMTQLAASELDKVTGISSAVFMRLSAQATIQNKTKALHIKQPDAPPCFEIIPHDLSKKKGLSLLPPHSKNDIFFDIEGFPLEQGGLEYLWGAAYFNQAGERCFKDFWAHDSAQEKHTFKAFIVWAYQQWLDDPTMHIYHYAAYEIVACRKLMGRYGICEHEVDQLLRNGVFVDLFKLVKASVRLGESRYSIKNVEHLYRGKRETDVGTGGDSIAVYEQWRNRYQQGFEGDTWQSSEILNNIRDYNIDDCNSTQELVDWLRNQQQEHGIIYLGDTDPVEAPASEEITNTTELRDRLLELAEIQRSSDKITAQLTCNMAGFLSFHQRESKPLFWRLFERFTMDADELFDDLDCLACCKRTEREPYLLPQKRMYAYEYTFDKTQEFKAAAKSFFLLGVENDEGQRFKVRYNEEESDLKQGKIVLLSKLPPPDEITLIPDEYVYPGEIPSAIFTVATRYEKGTLQSEKSAIYDFLTRSQPRFTPDFQYPIHLGDNKLAIAPNNNAVERLSEIINACVHLDDSYLTIQGPPGAGKTYTGKYIIADLIKRGKKVGITSNSHKAINNLLLSTVRLIDELNQQGEDINTKFVCTKNTDDALKEHGVMITKNARVMDELNHRSTASCVIGTTAWGFARCELENEFDYLFVDEAGQVSVANLIAMSRSTKNLIILGDQMQLGQPSQGTHPFDSGLSVLDYLMQGKATIPDDEGVFLPITYRMHSLVNQYISDHIYDGKLYSDDHNDTRVIDVPVGYAVQEPDGYLNKQAGIIFVPVEHQGNTQASDEEVDVISGIVTVLLERYFHSGDQDEPLRKITWDDFLFVSPYNHQVNKLKKALGPQAKVGSVDKFQGQEAPIVILSMCASDPAETPRGMDFLFDKNRLNVAVSRAQTLAIVVANPALGKVPAVTVEQLNRINLFNALMSQ